MTTVEEEYVAVNRLGWDQLARAGTQYSTPYGPAEFARARTILDPHGWLPWHRLRSVLCLASGGGQQGPLFASLGLQTTVVDLSAEQLALDRRVAKRHDLRLECIQGDMVDLSALAGRRFDLVYQPVSAIYVPDVVQVYREVSRVLPPGGLYLVVHWNPAQMQLADDGAWDGTGYRVVRPHARGPAADWTSPVAHVLHYIHPLADLLGGLCDNGFAIRRYTEWSPPADSAVPASLEHIGLYFPTLLTVLARRRAGG
jgi:SAM-dependent methyltransferase